MGENSAIEWTDHTFNPWVGCTKVSAGCQHCYAEREMDKRRGFAKWGDAGTRSVTSYSYWRAPLAWDRKAAREGARPRVFCASLSDVLEDWQGQVANSNGEPLFADAIGVYGWAHDCEGTPTWAPDSDKPLTLDHVRQELWALIRRTPHLQWMILTKRPQNAMRMIPADVLAMVWLGTSIENQATADERIPHLLRCPAAVRFLSCEPLLGPIRLDRLHFHCPTHDFPGGFCKGFDCPDLIGPDWVIAGGESGPNARPMHPEWARSVRDQCVAAGVAFFFKQWGDWRPSGGEIDGRLEPGTHGVFANGHLASAGALMGATDKGCEEEREKCRGLGPYSIIRRAGKKAAGRKLDGRTWDEYPGRAAQDLLAGGGGR